MSLFTKYVFPFYSKRKGSSNDEDENEDINVSEDDSQSKRVRLDNHSPSRFKDSANLSADRENTINGDSDEDDVFVTNSRPFQNNKHLTESLLDNQRPPHISPSSGDDPLLHPYHRSVSMSRSPIPLEHQHPMMRRLEMEARHSKCSHASTSSTLSSTSPKPGIIQPHPQLTPPLSHSITSQKQLPSIPSSNYLPPTPPSPYLPTSPFYHQYQQMLAAHRYQMLSQYAAAAAAANLPAHNPPFYASNAPHFCFPHPTITPTLALPPSSHPSPIPSLPLSSSSSLCLSPPSIDKASRSIPSPTLPFKADSTTSLLMPSPGESNTKSPLNATKFLGLPPIKTNENYDIETGASIRSYQK